MTRVTNALPRKKRKKRLLKQAKGFWGDRKNHLGVTKDAVMKAMEHNYNHRKQKKRDFRSLWIVRISSAAKIHGISYSKLINGLKKANCMIDRKMLADLAISDINAFGSLVQSAKQALA